MLRYTRKLSFIKMKSSGRRYPELATSITTQNYITIGATLLNKQVFLLKPSSEALLIVIKRLQKLTANIKDRSNDL